MSKYTLGPYYFHNGSAVSCPQVRVNDNEIAFCPLGKSALTGYIIGEAEAQANARFIVQACNSHADLLAALKELKGEFDSLLERIPDLVGYRDAITDGALARSDQAIAKAEE